MCYDTSVMNMRGFFVVLACATLVGTGCSSDTSFTYSDSTDLTPSADVMTLTSEAFAEGQPIPDRYTCNGSGISPSLSFTNVPEEAVALVLIGEDIDAPNGFTHWLVFNIPAGVNGIAEADAAPGALGTTSGGRLGYEGPCPPDGQHRYTFTLYAVRESLAVIDGASAADVRAALAGQVIATATLTGTYGK